MLAMNKDDKLGPVERKRGMRNLGEVRKIARSRS